MAFLENIDPVVVFAVLTASAVAIFAVIRLLLHHFYARAGRRWPFVRRRVEAIRRRRYRLVKKHGFLGLALMIAIPLPTSGVYAGAVLSWLVGMKWQISLLAVVVGAVVCNGVVTLSAMGIIHAVV